MSENGGVEFKAGDTVRVISTVGSVPGGTVGPVTSVDASGMYPIYVRMPEGLADVAGETYPFRAPELELIMTLELSADDDEELRHVQDVLATREDELDSVRKELAAFKANVVRVAREYANDNGWCEVVNEALTELGLTQEWTVTVTVTGTITQTVSAADEESARKLVLDEIGIEEGDDHTLHHERFEVTGVTSDAELSD